MAQLVVDLALDLLCPAVSLACLLRQRVQRCDVLVAVLAEVRNVSQHVSAELALAIANDPRNFVDLINLYRMLVHNVCVDNLIDCDQKVIHFVGLGWISLSCWLRPPDSKLLFAGSEVLGSRDGVFAVLHLVEVFLRHQ
jgi:hypothetical protein